MEVKYRIVEVTKLNREKQFCPQVIEKKETFFFKKEVIYNLTESTTGCSVVKEKNTKYWYGSLKKAKEIIQLYKEQKQKEKGAEIIETKIIDL